MATTIKNNQQIATTTTKYIQITTNINKYQHTDKYQQILTNIKKSNIKSTNINKYQQM